MALEIEKKFRISNFSLACVRRNSRGVERITQVYLLSTDDPDVERRIRKGSNQFRTRYFYTEKRKTAKVGVRIEDETPIDEECYNQLCSQKDPNCEVIEKVRHLIVVGTFLFEVDVYEGRLDGLVTLEVEAASEVCLAGIKLPNGFKGEDVTDDKRYSNRQLAEHGIPK